jgi:hypothetical protein
LLFSFSFQLLAIDGLDPSTLTKPQNTTNNEDSFLAVVIIIDNPSVEGIPLAVDMTPKKRLHAAKRREKARLL